ncbi:ABC transporter ATP-binding protein [Kitasatospora sp. NBC_00315]|uniref:ABC transporter ATP-binding protein n=1 Tax=Kitasatospora sp. NBC_00315 TaxID=2975963 RepID=UPI00324C5A8A
MSTPQTAPAEERLTAAQQPTRETPATRRPAAEEPAGFEVSTDEQPADAEEAGPGALRPELRRRARALLWGAVRPHRATVVAAMIAAAIRQVALLAVPWCVQRALDDGLVADDGGALLFWCGATAVTALVQFAGLYGWQYWAGYADAKVGADLRSRLLRHLSGLDRAALASRGHGDLAMRATRDTDLVREWVHGLAVWVVLGTTFVVVLPALAALDLSLLLVTLATLPFLVLVNLYFPKRFAAASGELSGAHGVRADAVADLLQVGTGLRGTGGHRPLVERHHRASAEVTGRTVTAARIEATWAAVAPFVPRLAVAAGVGIGGLAVMDGRLTLGALVAFTSWMAVITLATRVLVDRLLERGQADVAAARIDEALSLLPEVTEPDPVAARPLPATGALTLTGVSAVRDGRTVLGPLDLTVRHGEFVALSGATGAGKSTLLRLAVRLDDPAAGAVAYGGTDLRTVALDEIRSRIAYVSQRPVLLSGTVADNLRLGRELDDEALYEACRIAGVHDQLTAMPDGYRTELGEGGTALSGGQVQRLAIARALLGDPVLLLLDDSTSALDTTTERLVLDRLRGWAVGRTVLFATHRGAVLTAADRVVRILAPVGAPAAAPVERPAVTTTSDTATAGTATAVPPVTAVPTATAESSATEGEAGRG